MLVLPCHRHCKNTSGLCPNKILVPPITGRLGLENALWSPDLNINLSLIALPFFWLFSHGDPEALDQSLEQRRSCVSTRSPTHHLHP